MKRLLWLAMGVGFGFGMSFWITRAIKERIAKFSPENVSAELGKAARGLGKDLRAAVSEGVEAMKDREAELRQAVGSAPSR